MMTLFQTTAAVIILSITVCAGYEYCKNSTWVKFQGNCYYFHNGYYGRFSYYEGEDYCRGFGAHLASIHSQDEFDFINDPNSHSYHGDRQWVGLTDIDGRDKFRWSDGTNVDYLRFANKTEYFKESCFVTYLGQGWRREHCELRHPVICKKLDIDVEPVTVPPVPTPPQPSGNCPSEWTKFGNKCYKSFGANQNDRKDFKEARRACNALGVNHDLVSVHSPEEQAFLTKNLNFLGVSAWIGFSQIESDEIGHELVFGWSDNSRVNYTNWAPGSPERGSWKNCAALGYEGVGKGDWVANYCSIPHDKKGYICQRPVDPSQPPVTPPTSECGVGNERYRNDCYTFHTESRTWPDANATCGAEGGHLLSITDSFEQSFLYSRVGRTSFWTGLSTIAGSRIFHWADRRPFYYSNWAYGQPVLANLTKSQCVFADGSNGLTWNVSSCQQKLPFVCKSRYSKDDGDDGNRPTPPRTILGNCPAEETSWVDIGDSYCYHIGQGDNDRLSWATLSRYCLTKGMEMVSFHSDHEIKSLLAYLWKKPYDFWLGLIRTFDRKSFMWIDKSPLNYTNWAEREPSSWSSDKDCAGFSTSDTRWRVKSCSDWSGAICRAKKM